MKLFAATAVVALLGAGLARAAEQPSAYGIAQQGSFEVVASILLADTGGEMKGVWLDEKAGCRMSRTLKVDLSIDLVDLAGKTIRAKRSRRGTVMNCAEGGPNFGFDLAPRAYRMGCASGRWRPGRYSMSTRVTELRSGLVAQVSLYRQVTRRC